ncbi:hypothetical protein JCM8097_004863 [Rhodosporidiobolus ruineniae]
MAQTGQEPPKTLLEHTLRTAPLNVVYGTAASTALGAAAGAASGVARNAPAIPAAFKTAINTGVFSFTFFSIREYAAIPLLTLASLHPSPLPPSPEHPSSSPPAAQNPHTHNLLPTTVSGLFAGGAFSYFQRPGPPAMHVRAGVTLALGCAVLQGIVNEADVIRIKMLVWGEERARAKADEQAGLPVASTLPSPSSAAYASPSPLPASTSASTSQQPASSPYFTDLTTAPHPSSPDFSDPGRETFSERSDRLAGDAWGWVKKQAGKVSPVKRLEEGEYEGRLKGLLDGVEAEREKVKRERMELEALEKMLEKVEGGRK